MNGDQLLDDFQLVPPPWWASPLVWSITGAVVLLAAAGWLFWRFRPRTPPPPAPPAPGRDWAAEFLARLARLREQAGALGAYQMAIECSELLREYLEASHQLRIRYQTTREFLDAASDSGALSGARRQWLGRYLRFCDLLKFARRGAAPPELDQLLAAAEAFLRETTPAAPAAAPPEAAPQP